MPFSKGFSQPSDRTLVSCDFCIAGRVFTVEPLTKAKLSSVIIPIYHCNQNHTNTAIQEKEMNGKEIKRKK